MVIIWILLIYFKTLWQRRCNLQMGWLQMLCMQVGQDSHCKRSSFLPKSSSTKWLRSCMWGGSYAHRYWFFLFLVVVVMVMLKGGFWFVGRPATPLEMVIVETYWNHDRPGPPTWLVARYVSHMTGTSTAIGSRLEGFHHSKNEDDILIQARKADEGFKVDFTCPWPFLFRLLGWK